MKKKQVFKPTCKTSKASRFEIGEIKGQIKKKKSLMVNWGFN